jgi:hypothetical protein
MQDLLKTLSNIWDEEILLNNKKHKHSNDEITIKNSSGNNLKSVKQKLEKPKYLLIQYDTNLNIVISDKSNYIIGMNSHGQILYFGKRYYIIKDNMYIFNKNNEDNENNNTMISYCITSTSPSNMTEFFANDKLLNVLENHIKI